MRLLDSQSKPDAARVFSLRRAYLLEIIYFRSEQTGSGSDAVVVGGVVDRGRAQQENDHVGAPPIAIPVDRVGVTRIAYAAACRDTSRPSARHPNSLRRCLSRYQ